ncbi:uncharacterized protein LOC134684389 [Mytilus trossulus]|uniref:uncharacterized protein LOC134684389 n=1 Tax=Mytilus trossulus TaxID=6551 RepID=UPI003006E4BE
MIHLTIYRAIGVFVMDHDDIRRVASLILYIGIHRLVSETRIEKNRAKQCVFKLPLPEQQGKCSTDTSTFVSQSECKESCHADNTCRGFTYGTSLNICQQHDCPSSEKEGRSSTIYVRKLCGYSACQYIEIGGNKGAYKTQLNYFELCMSQCESYASCLGFELGSGSASSGAVCTTYGSPITTEMSSSGSRILFTKKCPGVTYLSPCKWTSHGNGTIGDCLFYDVIHGSLMSCLAVCDSEVWCLGISYFEELHMCYLYPCKSSVRQDETMQFYSHLCPEPITPSDATHQESTSSHDDILVGLEVMTSLYFNQTVNTTESEMTDLFSNPVPTTTARTTYITYNNTVLCLCKCIESSNETYPQFYNRIIEPLKLDKKQLSSYIRKRNSANDDRKSAAYFGYGGIFVLVTAIVVIVLADFTLLCKNINKLRKKASM